MLFAHEAGARRVLRHAEQHRAVQLHVVQAELVELLDALQLRAGPLQSLVDLANRVATRWLGFNGIGTIFNSFNGVLG